MYEAVQKNQKIHTKENGVQLIADHDDKCDLCTSTTANNTDKRAALDSRLEPACYLSVKYFSIIFFKYFFFAASRSKRTPIHT